MGGRGAEEWGTKAAEQKTVGKNNGLLVRRMASHWLWSCTLSYTSPPLFLSVFAFFPLLRSPPLYSLLLSSPVSFFKPWYICSIICRPTGSSSNQPISIYSREFRTGDLMKIPESDKTKSKYPMLFPTLNTFVSMHVINTHTFINGAFKLKNRLSCIQRYGWDKSSTAYSKIFFQNRETSEGKNDRINLNADSIKRKFIFT